LTTVWLQNISLHNCGTTFTNLKFSKLIHLVFEYFYRVNYHLSNSQSYYSFWFFRNPKLKMIPNLLRDLHMIYKLNRNEGDKDKTLDSTGEECQGKNNNFQPLEKVFPVLDQDLNYLPYEEDESKLLDNETDLESSPGSESILSQFILQLCYYMDIFNL